MNHRCKRFLPLLLVAATITAGAQQAPVRLTMADAIHRGLQANLGALVAETREQEAAAVSERRLSLLLPHVRVELPIAVQSTDLRAMGLSNPKLPLPEVVGPFSTYAARFTAEQPLLDMQALHALRSARASAEATHADYQDARELVVQAVASLYLTAQANAADTVSAQSRVETSTALLKLAKDQLDAGTATGIDALRAQVQLANDKQAVVQARNRTAGALLQLARAIGLEPGTPIELADPLEFREEASPKVESVLAQALAARQDYHALLRQRGALEEQLKASRARLLPKLDLTGGYGGIGRNIGSMRGVGQAQVSLSVTVFDHDREGEARELEAQLLRLDRQLNDARQGVEQEMRQSLLDLDSAAEEVRVAGDGLELAQSELELAQVRFKGGVASNIEVVTAQDALARAQQNRLVALTHHAAARIELARALGNAEQGYQAAEGGR